MIPIDLDSLRAILDGSVAPALPWPPCAREAIADLIDEVERVRARAEAAEAAPQPSTESRRAAVGAVNVSASAERDAPIVVRLKDGKNGPD